MVFFFYHSCMIFKIFMGFFYSIFWGWMKALIFKWKQEGKKSIMWWCHRLSRSPFMPTSRCAVLLNPQRYATSNTSAAVSTTVMSLGVYYAEIFVHLTLCHQCVFPSGAAGLSWQVVWVSGATRIRGGHSVLTRLSSGWRSGASELPQLWRSSLSSRELTQR